MVFTFSRLLFLPPRIAKLDSRIGNCTVLACNKWEPIFKECEASLGFSGDAANDVYSAWSRLASDSFQRRQGDESRKKSSPTRPKRSNSLTGMYGKTVKVPVGLIPLERARALTLKPGLTGLQDLATTVPSYASMSTSGAFILSPGNTTEEVRPEISRPINIEESNMCCSYPSGRSYRVSLSPYSPHADISPPDVDDQGLTPEESDAQEVGRSGASDIESTITSSFDLKSTIQNYVDEVSEKFLFEKLCYKVRGNPMFESLWASKLCGQGLGKIPVDTHYAHVLFRR